MDTLNDPNFLTRPPEERVPAAMRGTLMGEMYSRMARMNDGARHAELRRIAESALASWNLADVDRIARTYARTQPIENIAALTIAELIGIESPVRHLDDLLAYAKAFAFDADGAAIRRGIDAAPRLRAALGSVENEDEAANLLGFLFQATAAPATLIKLRLSGSDEAPVPFTRRWPRGGGDVVVVPLRESDLHFGAGPHKCPGRAIAETIAAAAVDEIKRSAAG